ncbi:hypothetical protein LTR62_003290 [Meristemomyces frigidus]|uniref:WD40 repeat-like protein n=1 Tax=Meristemomyces frigidus TaxID=1508187 RepID=A0AAN7TFP5_9PEZI|nr:hypothetical protein LTR62_003290 [Meristemomyces frigidus]
MASTPFSTHHLLVTTPSKVLAISDAGITEIFTSSKAGIVASRYTNNHLAIADGQVVILQDTRRGQDRSWGLSAHDDEIRLLDSTNDGFFLTTKLTHGVLHYNAAVGQAERPLQIHNATPVAMACSRDYVVSASKDPPLVSLKGLRSAESAVILQPRASTTAVLIVSFHPERHHIYLLGFLDGTVAGYNARKGRMDRYDGEFGRTKKAHRDLTGAVFLPGQDPRIVSVGLDGRCRIVDLKSGSTIRVWHAMGPLNCVSVSAEGTIAVGRVDGRVQLYSAVGVLYKAWNIYRNERIIGLEWVYGVVPVGRRQSYAPVTKLDAMPSGLGLPPGLQKDRRFTVHPDEMKPKILKGLATGQKSNRNRAKLGREEALGQKQSLPEVQSSVSTGGTVIRRPSQSNQPMGNQSLKPKTDNATIIIRRPKPILLPNNPFPKSSQDPPDLLPSPAQPLPPTRHKQPRSRITPATFNPSLYSPHRQQQGKKKGESPWHPGNTLEREEAWLTDSVQDSSVGEEIREMEKRSEKGGWKDKRKGSGRGGARKGQSYDGPWVDTDDSEEDDEEEKEVEGNTVASKTFKPDSNAVRALFPRTSSLSPSKRRGRAGVVDQRRGGGRGGGRAQRQKQRKDEEGHGAAAAENEGEIGRLIAGLEEDYKWLGVRIAEIRERLLV